MIEEEQGGKGALAVVIIIIVLLLVGGLYAVNTEQEVPEAAPVETEDSTAVMSTSTDLDDIDRDLENLNAAASETDFTEFEQGLQEL